MIYKNQQGWILLDSLIGIVILSVAILAIAANFMETTKGTLATDNQTKAAYLAHEQLSRLKIYDGQKQDRNSAVWMTTTNLPAEQNHSTVFTVETSVLPADEIPADLNTDVIPVKAVVTWNESTGTRQLQIVTYYYYGSRQ